MPRNTLRPRSNVQRRSRFVAPLVMCGVLAGMLMACVADPGPPAPDASEGAAASAQNGAAEPNPLRNAYFGDLHVHTRFSYDAFLNGTRGSPDDAYRYARGEPLMHPGGFEVQLREPMDFYAVSDHAVFLGMINAMADPEQEVSSHPASRLLAAAETPEERQDAQREIRTYIGGREGLLDMDIVRSAWRETVEAAERHNRPGEFTTFIAYEYTASPDSQNLHRNVIFRGSEAPAAPFSRLDSNDPEDMWAWLESNREAGIEAIAIPHNANGSNGLMFRPQRFSGAPFDAAYAERRMRNEPLVEITQIKGTTDTHPALSPNDEWADFEIYPYIIPRGMPGVAQNYYGGEPTESVISGSYVREAYLNGLRMAETSGFNPYRFGLVGSTDTHTAGGPAGESGFFASDGLADPPEGTRPFDTSAPGGGRRYNASQNPLFSAAGLAGVWAEENTRDSIFDAFRRKETFATTGPRIRVRFFAGYGYPDGVVDDPGMVAEAYAGGVAMGGELVAPGSRAPRFLTWATRDPASNPLQRLQVIKGWVDGGEAHERVYDVACSDGLAVDPATHRCPDNGAVVNLDDCSVSADAGDAELRTLWTDPDFDPAQRALYYVRVLENPSCRWSTWEAIRAGNEPRPDLPAIIQERAWSSPIWITP